MTITSIVTSWLGAAALIGLGLGFSAPAAAKDYSVGSEATKWPLERAELARFEGTIVDILCEIAGDCPADCGGGKRQLGVLRKDDGALILATKNTQPIFTGAAVDLLPYCNQAVEVDGQLAGFDENTAKIYQVQRIRRLDEAEFAKTNQFTKRWAERFPQAAGAGPWFQRDPRVIARIKAEGFLGIGPEAEQPFLADEFE